MPRSSRRSILAASLAAPALVAQAVAAPPVRDRFLGVWKLIAYQRKSGDGRVAHPFGEKPVGRIAYDTAGRMSAQLMRPGRKSTMAVGVSYANGTASDAELREAAGGFIAYFGTFDIDEASTNVIHHVEACLVPSWVGHDLKRRYRFEGNRLMLSAVAGSFSVDLIWERDRP
jgi:hypothetical protein